MGLNELRKATVTSPVVLNVTFYWCRENETSEISDFPLNLPVVGMFIKQYLLHQCL